MQSRRDQVEAQRYLIERLNAALVLGEPDAVESPTRRDTRSIIGSLVMGALALAGAAGYALLTANGSTAWKQPQTLIVDKDTGSRFVLDGGRLRPVLNLASAHLALGAQMNVATVSAKTIRAVPRGAPLGTAGAPDALPSPSLVNAGTTRVCATEAKTAPRLAPQADLVVEVGTTRQPEAPAMVVGQGEVTWLLSKGNRFALSGPSAANVLGVGDLTPPQVPAAWLRLIPQGQPVVSPWVAITDEAGPELEGVPTQVGQLVESPIGAFVVVRGGLTPLTELQHLLAKADPRFGDPLVVTARAVSEAVQIPPASQVLAPLPATVPTVQQPDDGRAPCVQVFPGNSGVTLTASLPDPSAQELADSSGATGADRTAVSVRPGGGALLAAIQPTTETAGDVSLVTDSGEVFEVADQQALTSLGYQLANVAVMPTDFLSLLPHGPTLGSADEAGGGQGT
ncbi:type VII secretion protein EccB [Angustibacter sp. McL0619]|uniref:type VII secretion protein EccB n=1 Tax=Angustibacter sp. McL0619 TaxID=3415676 RepID=UPI003CF1D881